MFTLFSAAAALLILYFSAPGLNLLSVAAPITGIGLLYLSTSEYFQSVRALSQADAQLTPGVLEAYRRSQTNSYVERSLLGIAFASLLVPIFDNHYLYLAWLPLVGLAIDLLCWQKQHIAQILDPYWLVDHTPGDLVERMDNLTSSAAMAIFRSNLALSQRAVSAMRRELSTAISTENSEQRPFFVSYWIKRLGYLSELTKQQLMTPLDLHILNTLGKSSVELAKVDPTLATLCLEELGRCAAEALDWNQQELVQQSSFVAVQAARTMLAEVKEQNLTDPLCLLVDMLEHLTKETFSRNKEIDINLLTQPIQDMRLLFEDPANSGRPDVVTAGATLNRILADFVALQEVMNQMRREQANEPADDGQS